MRITALAFVFFLTNFSPAYAGEKPFDEGKPIKYFEIVCDGPKNYSVHYKYENGKYSEFKIMEGIYNTWDEGDKVVKFKAEPSKVFLSKREQGNDNWSQIDIGIKDSSKIDRGIMRSQIINDRTKADLVTISLLTDTNPGYNRWHTVTRRIREADLSEGGYITRALDSDSNKRRLLDKDKNKREKCSIDK